MKTAPLVVIVFPTERKPTSTRFGGFARRLQRAGGLQGCEVVTVALENLAFVIQENGDAQIIDVATGQDIGRADFVYLKSWESMPEEAAALATYLQAKGIPYMDTLAQGMGVSKLATEMRLWASGLAVPTTVYVRRSDRLLEFLQQGWAEALGGRFIIKDILGEKGRLNFYDTTEALALIAAEHPTAHFMCQRFIPNDGDFRIGVYYNKARFAIRRIGAGDTHLNNTSAGGTAEYIAMPDVHPAVVALAEGAAMAAQLQVSGVDIIVDKQTGQPFVLEVNQGSQIVTGAFVEENMQAFNEAIGEALAVRFARPHKRPLGIIGRRAIASLPLLGVETVTAKIDTGAYNSTLHAEDVHIETDSAGQQELVFTVIPGEHLRTTDGKPMQIRTTTFFTKEVRSSNGQAEHRYSFKTMLVLQGRQFEVHLMLGDRSEMSYPLLVGRRALRSRFLVNTELNEHFDPQA